jgi:hypothetical protein
MTTRLVLIFGALLLATVTGCGAAKQPIHAPFVARGGESSGPGSGLWGDGSSGPYGMHIGCIRGRRFTVLITVHNRSKHTVTILGGGGPQPFAGVIQRIAVRVRLAPPPPKGDVFISGLRSWDRRNSSPAAIPPKRDGWVQSNFLMRNCALLRGRRRLTTNRTITLRYSASGTQGTQVIAVRGARMILTRGPVHPTLPINHVG